MEPPSLPLYILEGGGGGEGLPSRIFWLNLTGAELRGHLLVLGVSPFKFSEAGGGGGSRVGQNLVKLMVLTETYSSSEVTDRV